jgi:3-methyladenine DNA glycosylase/8-oxoguanine DNA glycosylase
MRRLHPAGEALSVGKIQEIAERWRPWRGYATVHLWSADA